MTTCDSSVAVAVARRLLAAAAATVVVGTACHDSMAPPRPRADLLPLPGGLAVSTVTTGSSLPAGYTVTVDPGTANATSQPIGATGVVTFSGLAAGTHAVLLDAVPPNCTVHEPNPQTVTVLAGVLGAATFTVSCAPTGNLAVATSTTGSVPAGNYTVTVDAGTASATSQPTPPNGNVTFSGLTATGHSVALSAVPANCTVTSANPQTVTVQAGQTASAAFTVSCSTPTGSLTVTTSTSGSVPTTNYTVTVDPGTAGATSQPIAPNGNVTFSGLTATGHSVALSAVPANCTVTSANPQTVTVQAGQTASAAFTVSCTATTGSLTATTSTSGSVPTTNYTATVDPGTGGATSQPIAPNGNVTFSGLSAASHSVALAGVPANCTVTSANPQSVTVPAGGTANASFTVSCSATTGNTQLTGKGQLGPGSPTPGSNAQTFDFSARSDLTGTLTYSDYLHVRADGSVATLTMDHTRDAATGITAFRTSSTACSDPSKGAEFDGVGRLDDGNLYSFTLAACDYDAVAGGGPDFLSMSLPQKSYLASGNLTSGDIVRSTF